jgi:AhpD family alkylhydroperoxidase
MVGIREILMDDSILLRDKINTSGGRAELRIYNDQAHAGVLPSVSAFREFEYGEKMAARIEYTKVAPGAFRAMLGLEKYLHDCDLAPSLLDLVKVRASQINGCAYCLDMHSKDARAGGETEQRLYLLDAWKESPLYSDRERAALAWTEALTQIADGHAPDAAYEQARQHFSEKELVDLSLAIVAINGWNRLAIGFRSEVGGYRPGMMRKMLKKAN